MVLTTVVDSSEVVEAASVVLVAASVVVGAAVLDSAALVADVAALEAAEEEATPVPWKGNCWLKLLWPSLSVILKL